MLLQQKAWVLGMGFFLTARSHSVHLILSFYSYMWVSVMGIWGWPSYCREPGSGCHSLIVCPFVCEYSNPLGQQHSNGRCLPKSTRRAGTLLISASACVLVCMNVQEIDKWMALSVSSSCQVVRDSEYTSHTCVLLVDKATSFAMQIVYRWNRSSK